MLTVTLLSYQYLKELKKFSLAVVNPMGHFKLTAELSPTDDF